MKWGCSCSTVVFRCPRGNEHDRDCVERTMGFAPVCAEAGGNDSRFGWDGEHCNHEGKYHHEEEDCFDDDGTFWNETDVSTFSIILHICSLDAGPSLGSIFWYFIKYMEYFIYFNHYYLIHQWPHDQMYVDHWNKHSPHEEPEPLTTTLHVCRCYMGHT